MKLRSVMGGLAAAVLCVAGPAFAIEAQKVDEALNFDPNAAQIGLDARVGLGAMTGDLGSLTAPGPLLGISAGAQLWPALGIEVGYEGQRLPIEDERVGTEQAMYRHNLGLFAKAGPMLMDDKLRPYVGAGFGVSYLDVTDGADDTGLYSNDLVREIPVGAGVDYRLGNIFAGARASYQLVTGEEFANDAVGGDIEGDLLNFSLTVGGRF
jgi:opacity protein-like surface antigen